MTRETRARRIRRKKGLPRADKVASFHVDHANRRFIVTTKDMILKQLERDGPRIRSSFDKIVRPDLEACSAIFGEAAGLGIRHLPKLEDKGFKATASRLLNSAASTYLASIEVARHGYRRQYGMLARSFVETIATVIVLAIRPNALEDFHLGKLPSNKCVGWAKKVVAPLGLYYGMLSDQFVHIGPSHATFEPVALYTRAEESLLFIRSSMRGDVWLLYLAAELVFHDEILQPRYWKRVGAGVTFDPSDAERVWMKSFLLEPDELDVRQDSD